MARNPKEARKSGKTVLEKRRLKQEKRAARSAQERRRDAVRTPA